MPARTGGRVRLEDAKKLSKKQAECAAMIAEGMPATKIKEILGISGSTLSSWRTRSTLFREAIHTHQRSQFEDTASRTHAVAHASVACLARLIASESTPPAVRVQACSVAMSHQIRLLAHGLQVRQAEALEARLTAVERRQAQVAVDADYVQVHELSAAPS